MNGRRKNVILYGILLTGLLWLAGCGGPSSASVETAYEAEESAILDHSEDLKYAENFQIDYYEDGCRLLTVKDECRILVVPKDCETPSQDKMKSSYGSDELIVLKEPIDDIYLVASAVMDIFDQLDALDTIQFSGTKAEDWYVVHAKEVMQRGDIIYAGKYSKPDYELLVSKGCSLAIENRMITHSPEVIEKLNDCGIPVMVDLSSYESHPYGRMEWIKFYGALLGKEEQADRIFNEQLELLQEVGSGTNVNGNETNGKTVAFFYITSNGMVQVRYGNDYIPKLIELAGGNYLPAGLQNEESAKSTLNMQVEEFYNQAKDADYIIYNSAIDHDTDSIDDLIDKCEVLKDFKAVKENHVYCTTNEMYQQSMSLGYFMLDVYHLLNYENEYNAEQDMKYLFQLQ